ncbi:type II toxin-antitoxin system RelE family toxin [Enterococcus sp. HY326]|uniref:type II toxin-antitoxin system RelE family toxin n=1 Tax=Enterococcus sp. HY326 TaxID=2971265 RepID=UPI00223F68A6|nr:type II toxin-antitoxin system RelE/ParE family toxin [Enterococcus sp. HY326]
MVYQLEFSKEVQKQLRKMDKHQAALIVRWLYKNVDGATNPRQQGKAFTGNLGNYWRYRIENYRAIVEIEDERLVITAIQIGHRRNIHN